MKLKESQIQDLFHFTERHYVEHYDVQVEIVDHLASAIEERLSKNPHQVFEQVLNDVYQGFGPMGLSGFVDSMEERVHKKGLRLLNSCLKEWFSVPKIGVTVALFILIYQLNTRLNPEDIRPFVLGSTLVLIAVQLLLFLKRRNEVKRNLLSLKTGYLAVGGGLVSLVNLIYGNSLITSTSLFPVVSSLFLTLLLVFFLAENSVSRRMFQIIRSEYPVAFA